MDLGALHQDTLVVGYPLLYNFLGLSQIRRLKLLIAVEVGESAHKSRPSGFGYPSQVLLLAPSDSHGAPFDKKLENHVIDALCGEDYVGPRLQDHFDPFQDDPRLPLADFLELLGIIDGDMNAKLHPFLLEVHVEARNLGIHNPGTHSLRSNSAVERIAFDQKRFGAALPVGLEKIYCFNWILGFVPLVNRFHQKHRIDNHICEEIGIRADDLARHGRFGNVYQAILPQALDFCGNVFVHVLDRLSQGESIPGDDGRGVYPVLHQFVGASQEFGSK